eukprot:4993755-Lingulodinium_polyedra.AAC.1
MRYQSLRQPLEGKICSEDGLPDWECGVGEFQFVLPDEVQEDTPITHIQCTSIGQQVPLAGDVK